VRVFISWSGELSRELGEAIRDWLPSALQFVRPYFTPNDIDKGAKWASEISTALSASSICIIVLTRNNLQSSWIMFEAGAISSTLDNSRVCPIVFDLEPTDLEGPLAQFQVTRFLEDDFRKLFNTVNSQAGENKLSDSIAQSVFDKWWPDLNQKISKILRGHTAKSDAKKIRSDRELIEEVLLLVRNQSTEKEAPRPGGKYEGSLTKSLVDLLEFIADETYWIDSETFNEKMVACYATAKKRLVDSEIKTELLNHLSALIERSKPKPKPPPPAAKRKPPDLDDDIPF
jgi:hypothetical protein